MEYLINPEAINGDSSHSDCPRLGCTIGPGGRQVP
ncbi:hypothetical protein HNR33_004188 [Brassicibacter mesophilus]|jgi:hypothetical protein